MGEDITAYQLGVRQSHRRSEHEACAEQVADLDDGEGADEGRVEVLLVSFEGEGQLRELREEGLRYDDAMEADVAPQRRSTIEGDVGEVLRRGPRESEGVVADDDAQRCDVDGEVGEVIGSRRSRRNRRRQHVDELGNGGVALPRKGEVTMEHDALPEAV